MNKSTESKIRKILRIYRDANLHSAEARKVIATEIEEELKGAENDAKETS